MGIALIISGSAATQQQALLTSFLVLMPSVMLSGFMFPINNMPEPIRYATVLNPMRWYLEILRGIVMKDVGFAILWPSIAAQTRPVPDLPEPGSGTIQKDPQINRHLPRKIPCSDFFPSSCCFFSVCRSLPRQPRQPTDILTLSEALEIALANNPSLREAEARTSGALEEVKITRTDFLPKASTQYGYTRLQDTPFQRIDGRERLIGDENAHHWDITLSQPLFTGFATQSRHQMAKISAEIEKLAGRQDLVDDQPGPQDRLVRGAAGQPDQARWQRATSRPCRPTGMTPMASSARASSPATTSSSPRWPWPTPSRNENGRPLLARWPVVVWPT